MSLLRVATPTGSEPAGLRPGVGSQGTQTIWGGASKPAARAAKRRAAIASLRGVSSE
jgi:hypothetical protein